MRVSPLVAVEAGPVRESLRLVFKRLVFKRLVFKRLGPPGHSPVRDATELATRGSFFVAWALRLGRGSAERYRPMV
jgi:hypothetical protein